MVILFYLFHFFSYWLPDEPNNYKGFIEDCVEINYKESQKGWNDLNCQSNNFFLCEKMII